MEAEELIQICRDITDYLAPLQAPYEQAIYNYLFRWSYLESGVNTVRKGKRTIAAECGLSIATGRFRKGKISFGAIDENIENLEKKGHIKIGDVTREGTLYTVLIPTEITTCIELKQQKEKSSNVDAEDYFNNPENRTKIFERDNYTCHYCGQKVTEKNATLDHFVPTSKGGNNSKENLFTSCLECNSIKSGKSYEEATPALLERLKEKLRRQSANQ